MSNTEEPKSTNGDTPTALSSERPTLDEQIAAVRADLRDWETTGDGSPDLYAERHIAALRAALATLEASRWRPIAEAPKDKPILACGKRGWPEVYIWHGQGFIPPRCLDEVSRCGTTSFMDALIWQPLPSPPTTSEGGEP